MRLRISPGSRGQAAGRRCSLRLGRHCSLRLRRHCSLRLRRRCSLRLGRRCSLRLGRHSPLRPAACPRDPGIRSYKQKTAALLVMSIVGVFYYRC